MMRCSMINQGYNNKQMNSKGTRFLEKQIQRMEEKLCVSRNTDFKTKYFFIQGREEQFLRKKNGLPIIFSIQLNYKGILHIVIFQIFDK